MNTINRAVFSSIVITSSLARGVLSDDFIIGKEEDEKILVLSIVFLAICAAFLLISVLFPILLLRKMSSLRRGAEYVIEMREERHQSMYTSNGRIDQQEPSHFEIFKLSDSNGATYLSPPYEITISPSNGPQNDQNETLQRKVATKEKQNLGAFENHAYQSGSMASGLENTSDAAVENDLNRPALK